VEAGDIVYIPQNEQHQFENIGDEPLGFLCVIPSKEWLARIQTLEQG
jgi:oxalate decarboxylase/phosphoglucose isomerase-like protein (cupin superfamily)